MKRIWMSALVGLVVLTGVMLGTGALPGAQAQDAPLCGEDIELVDNGDFSQGLAGWNLAEGVSIGSDGGNPVLSGVGGGAVGLFGARHDLGPTAGLDGVTLTFSLRVRGTVGFMHGTQSYLGVQTEQGGFYALAFSHGEYYTGEWQVQTDQVTLSTPAPTIMSITLLGNGVAQIDDVSVTYDLACPTPTPTDTPTPSPTETPSPTPTETPTPIPSPTATPGPTAEPTSTPTEVPSGDVEITVAGDPRFPVSGSAALEIPGLTYNLLDAPDHGSVVLNADGTFTYTADSYLVTFDRFTVLASDGTAIVVNVVLEIDPSVPTNGTVRPGGTGTGGDPDDARSTSGPVATTTTDSNDDGGNNDLCWRCD
jgi:hypothetical protein